MLRPETLRPLLVAIAVAVPAAGSATIYKWLDEDGRVTYSDRPPVDSSAVSALTVIERTEATAPQEIAPSIRIEAEPDTRARERAAARERESRNRAPRRQLPEAVRDPCLRSADRRCHERHSADYHPYLGYAPSVMRAQAAADAVAAQVGATNATAGGGSVAGGSGRRPDLRLAPDDRDRKPPAGGTGARPR